jgi:hypothetical protein
MQWMVGLMLVLLGGLAQAAVVDLTAQTQAALASAQTATGASTNEADFGVSGQRGAALFQLRNTAGTATVELQVNCVSGTADWATIPNSSTALTTVPLALDVVRPGCRYRSNVTACSGCSLTVTVTSIGQ